MTKEELLRDNEFVYSKYPDRLLDTYIQKDIGIIREIQEAVYQRSKIAEGDYIRMPDGSYERVTVAYLVNNIQIGAHEGSRVYISKSGKGQYSGGCGDSIPLEKISPTNEYKDGLAWHWHTGEVKAHNSIEFKIKWKVWTI